MIVTQSVAPPAQRVLLLHLVDMKLRRGRPVLARLALLVSWAASTVIAEAQRDLVQAATGLFEAPVVPGLFVMIHKQGRNFVQAEQLLLQALETTPVDAGALVLLGRVRATVGDLDEAEGLYRKALEASPLDAAAHHALAKLLTFQHRWKEAKESYERSLELHEENAEAWLGMGRVAMAMENGEDAERNYNRSLELDPTSALLLFDIGVLNCKKGEAAAAENAFARSAELNPQLDWKVVAQMFTGFNMISSARDAYKKAIIKDPSPEHQFAYGELCEALGDEDEAMKVYDSVLLGNPGMGKAHLRKALLLTGTGLTNLAAVHAFGLNKVQAKRHLELAVAFGEEGGAKQAAEALAFCETEEQEVQQWKHHVAALQSRETGTARPQQPATSASPPEGSKDVLRETPPWVEEQAGYLEVPEVVIEGAERFYEDFVNRSRPAVIKNFQTGFAAKEAWSWSSLAQRFGDSTVRVSLSETGRFDGPENGELWGLSADEEVLVRPPGTSMRLSDFVQLLRAEGLQETFYLEYLALHQYLGQPLREMLPLPAAVKDSGLELLLTNLWIGKGGTTAVLHYDDYENLLCQIRGTKELVLFPPADLENLYYVGRRKGKLKYGYPGKWTRDELDGSNKVFFSSSVRLDDPDFGRHPRLKRCRPYRVTLGEGDVLYMPAYWHHEVRSYPDEDEGNIAVNFWFRNVTTFPEEEHALGGGGGGGSDGPTHLEL